MPTDYTTTNITPAAPAAPGRVGPLLYPRPVIDWTTTNTTPASGGGPIVPRSNVGLVFPR